LERYYFITSIIYGALANYSSPVAVVAQPCATPRCSFCWFLHINTFRKI